MVLFTVSAWDTIARSTFRNLFEYWLRLYAVRTREAAIAPCCPEAPGGGNNRRPRRERRALFTRVKRQKRPGDQ